MQRSVLIFCCVLALAGCGGDHQAQALALESRLSAGDRSVISELESQAPKNEWAALALGRANQLGIQTKLDLANAMYFYSLAQNIPGAWYNAGLIYSQYMIGGLAADTTAEPDNACFKASAKSAAMKAVDCLTHAAASPNPIQARIALGTLYKRGQQDLSPNPARACQWFARAAEEHDQEGRFQYGLCLLNGDGVTQDKNTAIRLFVEAAKGQHIGATQELANLFAGNHDHVKDAFWHLLLAEIKSSSRPPVIRHLSTLPRQDVARAKIELKAWHTAHDHSENTNTLIGSSILPVSVAELVK